MGAEGMGQSALEEWDGAGHACRAREIPFAPGLPGALEAQAPCPPLPPGLEAEQSCHLPGHLVQQEPGYLRLISSRASTLGPSRVFTVDRRWGEGPFSRRGHITACQHSLVPR
jgi:hypothetical protein